MSAPKCNSLANLWTIFLVYQCTIHATNNSEWEYVGIFYICHFIQVWSKRDRQFKPKGVKSQRSKQKSVEHRRRVPRA